MSRKMWVDVVFLVAFILVIGLAAYVIVLNIYAAKYGFATFLLLFEIWYLYRAVSYGRRISAAINRRSNPEISQDEANARLQQLDQYAQERKNNLN